MARNNPRPGEIYKHFKNKLYQIITVATHSETGEKMVVYQALYGDFKTYVRPLDMFLSKVDKEKYQDVTNEYRFELLELTEDSIDGTIKDENPKVGIEAYENNTQIEDTNINSQANENSELEEGSVNPILMDFLEANTYAEKLSVLNKHRKHITDQLLNDMAVSLDVTVEEGEIDTRIDGFIFCLQTFIRFEDRRLR